MVLDSGCLEEYREEDREGLQTSLTLTLTLTLEEYREEDRECLQTSEC